MSDGQYILPSELAMLLGFCLLPAVVCAVAGQAIYLGKNKAFRNSLSRATAALISTVFFGIAIALLLFVFAPARANRVLGIQELNAFGNLWPVWPPAFLLSGLQQ